jgi:hypothetical protein
MVNRGVLRLLPGVAVVLLLVACGTTDTADPVTTADLIEPASSETHDPPGLPPRVESPIGQTHPSSVAGGAGNTAASGTNTNLNAPETTTGTVRVAQSDVVVTETPIVETRTETRVVQTPPVVVTERETIRTAPVETTTVETTRVMTRKD